MARFLSMRRPARADQRVFDFVERSERLQRRFKRGISLGTVVSLLMILGGLSRGRHLVATAAYRARQSARRSFGLPEPREEVDARHDRDRLQAVDDAARKFRAAFPTYEEPIQRLFRYAGSDPDAGLLRWGNYDQTFLLPSRVFLPDDDGRSYTLRPNTRSIWVRNVSIRDAPVTFLLVPDRPELREVLKGTGGVVIPTSTQTTNSWGLRGPEPDPSAPLRGIVLGDSFMQGLFVDDDHSPPECLRRYLRRVLKTGVSILNTGCLGYSPEQYYHSFLAFVDRFKPRFVVLSVFANDFGGAFEAARGKGDWEEGRYWLGEISQICRTRGLILLLVPVPLERQLSGRRFAGHYPGSVSNIFEGGGESYLDPTEGFVDRNMAMSIEDFRAGRRSTGSPLYNGAIGDGHFSVVGAEAWAEAVGRRLVLLLDKDRYVRRSSGSVTRTNPSGP